MDADANDDEVTAVNENIDQMDLLSRVKDLSGDNGTSSKSARLTFGIMEAEKTSVENIEHSMRKNFNLGGAKNKKLSKKNEFDKGYVGVQTIKDRPKKSPAKQRNNAGHSNRIINTQKHRNEDENENDETMAIIIESKSANCTTVAQQRKEAILSSSECSESSQPVSASSTASTAGSITKPLNKEEKLTNVRHLNKCEEKLGLGSTLASCSGSSFPSKNIDNLSSQFLMGNQERERFCLNPTTLKPMEGISGISLNSLPSAPPTGTAGLSLSSLASKHLSSSFTLSLNTSAPPQLSLPAACVQGGLKGSELSLGSLASSHLASSPGGGSKLSLTSLASSHLGSTLSGAGSRNTPFTIPAIFGSNPNDVEHAARGVSPEVDIDLMSALKLGNTDHSMEEEELLTELDEVKVEIVVPDISRIISTLRRKNRTSFSKVITKRWTRIQPFHPLKMTSPTTKIEVFMFAEPSPDDVVLKAQLQSRAFSRPSPVRNTRLHMKTT